jgi:VWFA-related protein
VYSRAISFALAIAFAGSAFAQSGRRTTSDQSTDSKNSASEPDIRLEVDEVRLNIKVYDPEGRPVVGLDRSNFIVAENGERQKISSFTSERAPANVVLVLDACSDVYTEVDKQASVDRPKPITVANPSILDKVLGPPYQPPPIRIDPLADLGSTRHVAESILERLGPKDQVCVIQASRKVELIQDWTSDKEAARHAVRWRYRLGEGTALWDAVYLAAAEQLSTVDGQRIVIVVSDGVDTASRLSKDDAAMSLDRSATTVYFVSSARLAVGAAERYLGDEGQILAPRRRQALSSIAALEQAELSAKRFSERSGGSYFALATTADYENFASTIFGELQTAYVLSYISTDERHDGAWRAIAVFFDRPGLTARTRRGYFATVQNR